VGQHGETQTQYRGVKLGYLVLGGNKCRNLALQVGGFSKIETIEYAHESRGTQTGKGCAGEAQQKRGKLQTELLVREGALYQLFKNN
jgi:hypothetical protein